MPDKSVKTKESSLQACCVADQVLSSLLSGYVCTGCVSVEALVLLSGTTDEFSLILLNTSSVAKISVIVLT